MMGANLLKNLWQSGQIISRRRAVARLVSVVLTVSLCACGGSGGASGGDAGAIAEDGFDSPMLADDFMPQDDQACLAEIDIAEFFLTEIDRQWACEINSAAGSRFDEIFFDRRGTATTGSGDIWYWNRNLASDEVNLASPGRPAALMTDIGSSNTVLFFRTVSDAGVEEVYDCVLVSREIRCVSVNLF